MPLTPPANADEKFTIAPLHVQRCVHELSIAKTGDFPRRTYVFSADFSFATFSAILPLARSGSWRALNKVNAQETPSVSALHAERSVAVSKKSPVVAAEAKSSLADLPLIPVPEVARRHGVTKGVVLKACAACGIEPRRTASGRDHLTFNEAVRIIGHLHQAA